MRVVYRYDIDGFYTFLVVEGREGVTMGISEDDARKVAMELYRDARRINACMFVQTLRDSKGKPVIAYGVVCRDCNEEVVDDVGVFMCRGLRGG